MCSFVYVSVSIRACNVWVCVLCMYVCVMHVWMYLCNM
jgi:hypothetical protein